MTHRDQIDEFVRRFPGRDDDEISRVLAIRPRQRVNQVCRLLQKQGQIVRKHNPQGKLANYPSDVRSLSQDRQEPQPIGAAKAVPQAAEEWFWEGNIVDALETFLVGRGWNLIEKADTASRQRGVDLRLKRKDKALLVEAKGYPSKVYSDPRRASESKPTNPSLQAQHWFSHALLKALRLRTENVNAHIAIALPDFPRYRALVSEIGDALERLNLALFFVAEGGGIECINLSIA